MGGVDKFDMLAAIYRVDHKSAVVSTNLFNEF